jgi:hypothetical protein
MKLIIEIDTDALTDAEYDTIQMTAEDINEYLRQNGVDNIKEQLKDAAMGALAEIIAP